MKTFKDDFPKVGDVITLQTWDWSYRVSKVDDLSHLCLPRNINKCRRKCITFIGYPNFIMCYNAYHWKKGNYNHVAPSE